MQLGTSVALAALLIWQSAWLRSDIRDLRRELQADNEAWRAKVDAETGGLHTEIQADITSLRQ